MKSPSRDRCYQLQMVNKIRFTSPVYLRFLLSTFILLGLVLHPTSGVSAGKKTQKATLVLKGSVVCTEPGTGRTDIQKTEGKIPLLLPKEDGPIEGKGWWRVSTTGYGTWPGFRTGGGAVVLRGKLRNGFLIFPELDYYLDGKLQVNPHKQIIRLRAVGGSKFVQTDFPGCEGQLVYRLEMPGERWEVVVDGGDRPTFGSGGIVAGISITWRIRMEIGIEDGEIKEGSGVVNALKLEPYSLPPDFWICRPLSGRFPWDGHKYESMTFTYPAFDVDGSLSGRTVDLWLPENKYFIAWEAHFNELEAAKVFRNKGGQRAEDRVRGLRQDTIESALVPLPRTISAVLRDGWSSPKVNVKAYSWQRVHARRIR